MPFVVALAGTPEKVVEQVVGLELGEGAGALAAAIAQYLGHRQLGIVVEDALGHATQEGEGRHVAVQEGLGGLGGIGFHIAAVAVRQVDNEAVGLLLNAADDHHCLAEVALGVTRRVGQRHEHLLGPPAMLSHIILDDSVATVKAVLLPESLVDAFGSVPLLPGDAVILIEDAVDDTGEGIQLGTPR